MKNHAALSLRILLTVKISELLYDGTRMENEIAAEGHKLDDQQTEAAEESRAHIKEIVHDEFPEHEESRTNRDSNESKGVDKDEHGDNGDSGHGGERFVEENLWKTEIGTDRQTKPIWGRSLTDR